MKYLLSLLFISWIIVPQVQAQETPETQLEFIRRLRDKGYYEMALEKIDGLKTDAALAGQLELERARTLVAQARDLDADRKAVLLSAARTALNAFVQKNPAGPEGAQGRLEIAQLDAYQGQTFLNQAQRDDDTALAKKAQQLFLDAGQELDAAILVMMQLIANYQNSDPIKEKQIKQLLAQDLLQARLDRASNLLDQALTYLDTSSDAANLQRAQIVDQAKQTFTQLADDRSAVGFMASAWLIKVNQEGQAPTEAEKYRKKVMAQTSPAAVPAKRLASLFYIQGIPKNPTFNKLDPQKKYKLIEDEGKKWLAAYPTQQKTAEGLAVRFELAQAMFMEAQALAKDANTPPTKAAQALYIQAQKHFTDIAASDGNLAEKARDYNVNISVHLMAGNTSVGDLRDFASSYLKAQIEMFKMKTVAGKISAAAPKDRENLESQRKGHLREVIKALSRAIALADAKTPPKELDEARFLLTTGYMMAGDWYRAALAGEALGHSRPPGKRSSQAAGYALEAYATILQADNDESNRRRFLGLADFILSPDMQKKWGAEPVTSVARYYLAMTDYKENNPKGAIAQLEQLAPDYSAFVYAQGQLVFIALAAAEKAGSDAEKKAFAEAARKAIARIPNLPGDADPNTGGLFFRAQLERARFAYADAAQAVEQKDLPRAEKMYFEMDKFVTDLKTKLDKTPVKLPGDTRSNLDFAIAVWAKYARLGLADLDYRKGQYDKVLTTTEKAVAKVALRNADGKSPIKIRDYQVIGELLGLALRAHVQKGNIAKAEQILGYLDRLSGEQTILAETTNVRRSLIADLQTQIKELKQTNDSERLKKTVKNFSAFIDKIAVPKDKALDARDIRFLASCYSSLEEYAKAAGLYAKITEPPALTKEKLSDEEEQEIATYWSLQIQYARALRLSAKDKGDLARAKKILDVVQKHKHSRPHIHAEIEQIHLLEDSAKFGAPLYGLAIKGWANIMNNNSLKAKMANDPDLKKLYFNAYYQNAWCFCQLSQTDKVIATAKEKSYLTTAANYILRLENSPDPNKDGGWSIVGHQFRELLASEPKLRSEYESLRKTAK